MHTFKMAIHLLRRGYFTIRSNASCIRRTSNPAYISPVCFRQNPRFHNTLFLIYFPTWYSCLFASNITILIYDIFANPIAKRAQSSSPCPQNRASQRRRTMYQSPFLPSRARIRVMASACPSPAPAGIPWARRVTRQSNADNCSAR